MMANLAFCVLGPMQITCDGAAVTGLESTKAQALLVYLAVEGSHPHRRATLAALLWPGESEAVSQHNLRQALANLRQALGDRTAAPPFLLITRTTIQFNLASTSWLDVDACTALLAACETHPHRRATTCASCAARRAQAVGVRLHHPGHRAAGVQALQQAPVRRDGGEVDGQQRLNRRRSRCELGRGRRSG